LSSDLWTGAADRRASRAEDRTAPQRVQEAIARYQPHIRQRLPDDEALALHALDNRNKHRSIDPQLVSYESMLPAFHSTGGRHGRHAGLALHDGLEDPLGNAGTPASQARVVAALSVVFPCRTRSPRGPIEGVNVVRVLFDLHEHVRSIHEHLLVSRGTSCVSLVQTHQWRRRKRTGSGTGEMFGADIADDAGR